MELGNDSRAQAVECRLSGTEQTFNQLLKIKNHPEKHFEGKVSGDPEELLLHLGGNCPVAATARPVPRCH